MVNVVISTGVVLHVDNETETAVEIFFRSIKNFPDKITKRGFQIICLTEVFLNDFPCNHKLFPDSFTSIRFLQGH